MEEQIKSRIKGKRFEDIVQSETLYVKLTINTLGNSRRLTEYTEKATKRLIIHLRDFTPRYTLPSRYRHIVSHQVLTNMIVAGYIE